MHRGYRRPTHGLDPVAGASSRPGRRRPGDPGAPPPASASGGELLVEDLVELGETFGEALVDVVAERPVPLPLQPGDRLLDHADGGPAALGEPDDPRAPVVRM